MKLLKQNLKLFVVEESGGEYDDAWEMISSIWVTRELAENEIKRRKEKREKNIKEKEKNKEYISFTEKEEIYYNIIEFILNKPYD